MEQTVYNEFSRLVELEPEVLYGLVNELTLYLKEEQPMRGYVYLMKYSTGFYKIGFAKKPPTRQYSLEYDEKGMEVKVEIVHVIETDDMKRLEGETALVFNQTSKYVGKEMWVLSQEDLYQFCSIRSAFYGDKGSTHQFLF